MIKQHYDKKTGRVHNLLLRSHEEKMTDFVYEESKMIKKQINYSIEFTEQQAKELYQLLRTEKDSGCLTPDKELVLVYNELRKIFDEGIR
jgi:Na+/phosphate symporter